MMPQKLSMDDQDDSEAENSQHSCMCSSGSNINPALTDRERKSNATESISRATVTHQNLLRSDLESLRNVFEPLRKIENDRSEGGQIKMRPDSSKKTNKYEECHLPRQASSAATTATMSMAAHDDSLFTHNLSCNFKNLDLVYGEKVYEGQRIHESSALAMNLSTNDNCNNSTSSDSINQMEDTFDKDSNDRSEDFHKKLSMNPTATSSTVKNTQQMLETYEKQREYHRERNNERHLQDNNGSNEECLLHSHFLQDPQHNNPENVNMSQEIEDYQHQQHVSPYHHRHHHHYHHRGNTKVPSSSHNHMNYHSRLSTKHPHSSNVTNMSMNASINSYVVHPENSPTSNVNTNHYHRHHRHENSNFGDAMPTNHHHRINESASGALNGTSSSSSLINCHITDSSSTSTSPQNLITEHHRDSSSVSSTTNNHLVSSSRESSSSRTHGKMEHFQDGHHHRYHHHYSQRTPEVKHKERLQSSLDHYGAAPPPPPPPLPPSPPQPPSHHHNQYHDHGHSIKQTNQNMKNANFIGINRIQVSMPSKSKCQCHALQEVCRNKRVSECGSDGNGEMTSIMHQPPALPPRPPPRPTRRYETTMTDHGNAADGACCKKYVILCSLCGGLSATVGSLFLAIHAVLSAHTASLALFETVPSYIPGTMLIIMGFFTMLLARRKHRYGLLMKVCGSVGVVCALVCVLVTVTTTVVHMSRLQGLRECVYTARARSCTCYEAPQSKGDPGVLFEGTPHCEAVHGALYACLRALFGVSVAGILACIFSCMLVYQLLSHEKKKMYWEQLELRYRSLYGQGAAPGVGGAVAGSCSCCNDCGATGSWWAQTPGNLYTPNPDLAPSRRWRLPWSRSRGPAPSPDSNYGFHTQSRQVENSSDNTVGPYSVLSSQASGPYSVLNTQTSPYNPNTATYSVLETPVPLWGPPPPYSDPNSPARRPHVPDTRSRIGKRLENFDNNEDYRARVTNKRPSDNYENAEDLANSTDPEGGNEGTIKSRRIRKPLKGVENCAFQQESNSMPKQSESELYFGDVSSCCGPESSFYDVALDKEVDRSEGMDYLTAHLGKRQLSKRSRLPLPLPSESGENPSNSYANNDDSRNMRMPYLAPDAQYEVIQQGRYSYYASKSDEEKEEKNRRRDTAEEEQTEEANCNRHENDARQCSLNDTSSADSGWQNSDQIQQNIQHQQQGDDNVRPVNV